MSQKTEDVNELLQRMRTLRNSGTRDVQQLQVEMERVSDWREHVRARPVATAVTAAVVGFVVVRTSMRQQRPIAAASAPQTQVHRSATSSVLGFLGGMASTFARQWVNEFIRNELKVRQHGGASQQSSSERESSTR